MKRFLSIGLVTAALVAGAALAQDALTMKKELSAARDAMADRNYAEAGRRLTDFVAKYRDGERVEEAEVLLLRSKIHLGDFEGALRLGRELLGTREGSPWTRKVRLLMGEAFARMRGFQDAARIYREQVDFLSGDVHERKVAGYYLELARKAYEGEEQPDEFGRKKLVRDYPHALEYYLKARGIRLREDEEATVSHRIADCYFQTGNNKAAVEEWKHLLEKWSDAEEADDATYHLGAALMRLGKDVEARTWLRKLRERFGDSKWSPHALIALGASHHPLTTKDEGEYSRGVAYWKEFRKLYPSHERAEEVLYDIGEAAFRFGRYDEAITEFRAFLTAFPDAERSPKAKDRIAGCFFRKHEFDRAIAEWKEFLGKWPNHELWTKVQGMIAKAAFAKGKVPFDLAAKVGKEEAPPHLEQATAGFRAFLATYPVHELAPEAQYLLGEIRHQLGENDAAITEWRIVATKYGESGRAASALFRIATTLEKEENDLAKAIETFEELVRRYPASSEAGTARGLLEQFRKKLLEVVTERACRTDETPTIKLRTRNIEKLLIRGYRLDLEETFRRKLTLAEIEKVVVDVVTPAFEITDEYPKYEKYRLIEREIGFDFAKGKPGAYILTLQDEDLTATTLLLVSDLTIVTKESPDQTLVFALNERTGDPVPGARLLLAQGGKIVHEGRTGRDGVFVRETKSRRGRVVAFAEWNGNVAATDLSVSGAAGFGYSTKVFLTTDRPLYRPGHEVKMKGIYRRVSGGGYVTSDGEPLDLRVTDARGTVVLEERVTTNEYGTFSRELYLPEASALGTWRVSATTVTGGKKTFHQTFEVQEFKKPEFTISARTDRRAYLPGEKAKVSVSLRYFFGGPVPRTAVRYSIARGPFAFDPSVHEEFAWFTMDPERERERKRRQGYDNLEFLKEGELRTNGDGNVTLDLETRDRDEDARYLVFFEALDLNRQWVRETASIVVTRQGYFALAKTEKKVYRPGEKIDVRLTTVDAMHFPVAAKGELLVVRRIFEADRESESIVSRRPAATGEDGRATVTVKVDRPGEYLLRFVGKDRRDNRVAGTAPVTLAGESEDLSRHARVAASRQIYREGEEAEILLNSPVAPAWALLTFEGERVLDHRVVHLTERSTTLTIPMKPLYSPNVFVKVAIPKDHTLHEAQDEIYVFKYLNVAVAPSSPEAAPGDKVSFTVSTTDQRGKPVPAEVCLSLVDRSILALAPDRTEQMKPFFYDQRRKLAVVTGSSYAFRHAGTTRPTVKDVLIEQLRAQGREKFEKTMKLLQAGKELAARGDLEGAVLELRRAIELAPSNYEARELVARLQVQLRRDRQLGKLAERMKELKDKYAADEEMEDSIAEDARKWSGSPAKRPPATKSRPAARAGGAGGRRYGRMEAEKKADLAKNAEPAASPSPAADAPAAGAFFHRGKGGDFRGRSENLFKVALGDVPALGYLFSSAPLVPPELRKHFADTAGFFPHLVTGSDGKAQVEVELPDNLTEWRAVARGVTKDTLVGEGGAGVVARKDVLVRVDTPRFLTQKDRVTVAAAVHNNLSEAVDVHLSLAGENIALLGDATRVGKLAPSEIETFDVGLVATEQGVAKLTAKAMTTVASDAAETGVPVLPRGLKTVVGRSGTVTTEALETFDLPDGIIPGTKELGITLSPAIDGSILESVVYLGNYPYACLEQTVNRFLPAIAAEQALRSIGSPNEALKAKLADAVSEGLVALYSFQNPDGSFGWFSGDRIARFEDAKRRPVRPGDPVMTAFAILGMERAREAGYRVSAPNRDRALAAGQRLVKATDDHGEKAFLLWALSTAGKADFEDLNQVYRYRDGLSSHALATLALAMHEAKRPYNVVSLVRILRTRAKVENGLAYWPGDGRRGGMNDVETTAFALRALLRTDPQDDLVDQAARWLVQRKRGPAWVSTLDTGAAVLALAEYLVREGVEKSDYVLEVWLNDGKIPYQKVRVAGGRVVEDQSRFIEVDGARLRTGENRIKLVKRGPGRCFYTASLTYFVAADRIEPAGNLLTVGRRYAEYVSPVAAKEGRQEIRPGWTVVRPEARPKEDPGATIDRAGSAEKFRVRLTLRARENLRYVIVEDPLPAGVEVVEGQADGPFDWTERRNEKQLFFLTEVPAGETEISYLVQAIHPGEFTAMPTMAWPMYEPEIQGRTADAHLTVVPEGEHIGRPETPEGITPDEVYALAVRDFREKRWKEARAGLSRLLSDFALLDKYQEECQAMLMRASFELRDSRGAVEAYERLVELNPRRGPKTTDERRKLAVSYQEIGEHERALALFRDVTDEYLARELGVAETYRRIGNPWLAQDFTERVLRSYPDSNEAVAEAYRTAIRYLDMARPGEKKEESDLPGVPDTALMLPEALDAFHAFTASYPESPLADDASRMAVTVLTRMDDADRAIGEATKFIRRYKDSVYLDDVIWYLTEAWYSREKPEYDRAIETGKMILSRKFRIREGSREVAESPFVPHVLYLFARIHHLRGELSQAVDLYRKVAPQFEDARDALAFLTEASLQIPETAVFGTGEAPRLTVRRKNLTELSVKIYRVDLMRLIAVKKDLRAAHEIDLTGIATENRVRREFPDGRDFRWHEDEIPLRIGERGVYLVVAKSGEIVRSSIVIVSDLEISVQVVGDRVRVYATDRKTKEPLANVFVKISDGREIRAMGFTDPRGVFEGRNVSGAVMVVAETDKAENEKEGHFALYRR